MDSAVALAVSVVALVVAVAAADATEAVGEYGSRVSLVLKADIRPGFTGELDAKVDRLEAAMEHDA